MHSPQTKHFQVQQSVMVRKLTLSTWQLINVDLKLILYLLSTFLRMDVQFAQKFCLTMVGILSTKSLHSWARNPPRSLQKYFRYCSISVSVIFSAINPWISLTTMPQSAPTKSSVKYVKIPCTWNRHISLRIFECFPQDIDMLFEFLVTNYIQDFSLSLWSSRRSSECDDKGTQSQHEQRQLCHDEKIAIPRRFLDCSHQNFLWIFFWLIWILMKWIRMNWIWKIKHNQWIDFFVPRWAVGQLNCFAWLAKTPN